MRNADFALQGPWKSVQIFMVRACLISRGNVYDVCIITVSELHSPPI